jgi:hypothetical protein
MASSKKKLLVKTMSDYNIESIIRNPYSAENTASNHAAVPGRAFRPLVQNVINNIIHDYFQLPVEARDTLNILKLIYQHWQNFSHDHFESKGHYFTVLATTTDYLLQLLTLENNTSMSNLPNTKMAFLVKELQWQLGMAIDFTDCTQDSIIMKKFLLEANEKMKRNYAYLLIAFAHKIFGVLPKRIEIHSLIDGESLTKSPTNTDLQSALSYVTSLTKQQPLHNEM